MSTTKTVAPAAIPPSAVAGRPLFRVAGGEDALGGLVELGLVLNVVCPGSEEAPVVAPATSVPAPEPLGPDDDREVTAEVVDVKAVDPTELSSNKQALLTPD